jgi:5'-3' exonuclease
MSEPRTRKRFMDCNGLTIEEAEEYGRHLATIQRDVHFWLGDLARYAETRFPDTHFQIWPEWISPDLLARCAAVARAYPNESDRAAEATYTIFMREANKSDRIQRVQAHVDAGRTSDEANKANQEEHKEVTGDRRLLAIDVHLYTNRWFHSTEGGVATAHGVATWIQRTAERMKAEKKISDLACCFDSSTNHRKELTRGWEQPYKDREQKDPVLVQQLQAVRELLEGFGFCCVSQEGMESDDIMASFAAQFPGSVILMTNDKDLRQCLSPRCIMLTDVKWLEDPTSGDMLPDYHWLNVKQHLENTGLRDEQKEYIEGTGITPEQWTNYQTLRGDPTDTIQGAIGVGEKFAADFIRWFGTPEAAIEAAKADDDRIKPAQRKALIEFEERLDVTRQLVTLRRDLPIPNNTRI